MKMYYLPHLFHIDPLNPHSCENLIFQAASFQMHPSIIIFFTQLISIYLFHYYNRKQTNFFTLNQFNTILISIQFINKNNLSMFCCPKKEQHCGQIVNFVCLQQQCIRNRNQLCCPVCIQQEHKHHTLNSMKKMIPQFLTAHKEKQRYFSMLHNLLNFVIQNFGQQNSQGQNVTIDNIVSRSTQVMTQLRNQVQLNNQQIYKMKDIFKNLNKNANQNNIPVTKSTIVISQKKNEQKFSPQKSAIVNSPLKSSKLNYKSPLKSNLNDGNNDSSNSIDTFSHNLKHPYLSLSSDCRTAIKSSHPGHRYAALISKSMSPEQNQVRIKIDGCPSGNIMIGLCHQKVVKQKDFVNNYGTGHGTYLIGQNGSNPVTAISFHHTIGMMNRKQIVGWNFVQGDTLAVGFNYNEEYVYFKLEKPKGKSLEFSMSLLSEDSTQKDQVRNLIVEDGLKFVVLLQNVGDQISILQS